MATSYSALMSNFTSPFYWFATQPFNRTLWYFRSCWNGQFV